MCWTEICINYYINIHCSLFSWTRLSCTFNTVIVLYTTPIKTIQSSYKLYWCWNRYLKSLLLVLFESILFLSPPLLLQRFDDFIICDSITLVVTNQTWHEKNLPKYPLSFNSWKFKRSFSNKLFLLHLEQRTQLNTEISYMKDYIAHI